jgi:hypothetical protein
VVRRSLVFLSCSACAGPSPTIPTVDDGIVLDGESSSDDAIGFKIDALVEPSEPVVLADPPPPPTSGGTLLRTRDGASMIAADPDRDLVFVIDTASGLTVHHIALAPGDEPGRLAEDHDGLVHIAARRSGEVVTIDPHTGVVVERRWACANPRGLAVDEADQALLVACAEGVLVRIATDDARTALDVGTELQGRRTSACARTRSLSCRASACRSTCRSTTRCSRTRHVAC